ncbi:leucine-rich repeat domain-containing protein [Treponema sp. TIM-1]|uniref:leucine-rich repeat domain-containing protein n=1 Tax=Treponema sp. TIM-1 TaxID=2898417 RepID=UPI00398187DC
MKKLVWAVIAVILVLAGCSQPLEGIGSDSGRDTTGLPATGITSFSVAGIKGEIAGTTIYVRDVPLYTVEQTLTDLRNAAPIIGYKGGTLTPAPDTARDFSTPKIYTMLMENGAQVDYTVVVTARPLRSAAEIEAYLPIAAKVYAGTDKEPIPVPVGLALSAQAWREILIAIQNGGKYVALDLSACTASTDIAGGGLYGDRTFDPGPDHTGENRVVSLVLPGEAERIVGGAVFASAFKRYTVLGSVFGAGIRDVDRYAFSGCDALTMVSLPAAANIGADVFSGCDALTTVSLPKAASIGEAAFYDCVALTTVSFPVATSIGNEAFSGCTGLTTASLPDAASIGNDAFSGCAALEVLDLFAATSIGTSAFSGCTGLKTISLPAATSIGSSAFSDCIALKTVSLPAARTIGSSAFSDCDALKTISLPSATTIGTSAFRNGALISVDLPAARTIGTNAFAECDALTTISLLAATTIGSSAFANCDVLISVDLPAARTINDGAFSFCNALTTIYLPVATTIGRDAFAYSDALLSVDLPAAKTIGYAAFYDCNALKSVNLPSATSFAGGVFGYTGTETLTVTLGASPPALAVNIFIGVGSPKTVTVKVPNTSAYGTSLAVSSTDSTVCWGNGFRGRGWDGSSFANGGVSVNVNSNINLTIATAP